jgi:hypothetical protein
MLSQFLRHIIIIWLLFGLVFTLSAQDDIDDTCQVLVQTVLETVGDACAGLGRNQVCYGHNTITALDFELAPLEDFVASGDTSNMLQVSSLATAPMDVTGEIWGVAILALQTNLPNTMPGQNVTFVIYGDTQFSSENTPDEQAVPPPTLTAQSSGAINIRTGPNTNYAIAGVLADGEEVLIIGRNAAGDWVQIDYGDTEAWVYTSLVEVSGDMETLFVVEAGEQVGPALQAFSLTTGLGEPACKEAPRDGLLVQAPADTTVQFLINGIEVTVGSTALLQFREDTLGVNTFDGAVSVTSAGETQTAEPGQRVDAVSGQPPAEPVPYDAADVLQAPVSLLPEPVSIPLPFPRTHIGWLGVSCDGAVFPDLPIAWLALVALPDVGQLDGFSAVTAQTVTFDGQPVELWTTRDIQLEGRIRREWWWVISDPQPGSHDIVFSRTPLSQPFKSVGEYADGSGRTFGAHTSSCTFVVE